MQHLLKCIRRFSCFKAGSTPQDVHTSIIAFAVILWLERKLFSVICTKSSNIASAREKMQLRVENLIGHIQHLCHSYHVCKFSVSPTDRTSTCRQIEQSSGRQEPFNYHCERLIVISQFILFCLHVHSPLIKNSWAFVCTFSPSITLAQTAAPRKYN